MIQLFVGYTHPAWPGGHPLGLYLLAILAIPAVDILVRNAKVLAWFRGIPASAEILGTTRLLLATGLFLFQLFWLQVLSAPLPISNLLFPISAESYPAQSALYTERLSWIARLPGEQAQHDARRSILISALHREIAQREAEGDGALRPALRAFASWQDTLLVEKGCALGLCLLISILNGLVLTTAALRVGPSRDGPPRRSPRFLLYFGLVLVLAFQACILPFCGGMLLSNHDVFQVRVTSESLPSLDDSPYLLLGERHDRLILYRPQSLWLLLEVPRSEVETLQILGKGSCLAWVREFAPEL
ncbi:MAG: hypothetical protein AAGD06_19760 [Acidobacteriota bacterium]